MLDFEGLGRELLANAESFVSNLFPQGKRRGAEWCIGSLGGEPGESLKINLKTGIWKDFADEGVGGGDLISLYAARHSLTQKMAAEELGAGSLRESMPRAAVNLRSEPERILERPPDGVARPKMKHPEFGLPVKFWVYRDHLGPLGLVARYEPAGSGKQIVPWTWDGEQGRFRPRGFPKPRPLYGLEHLHSRAGEPVLIVEGEKACDAARTLMPRYVCITWSGGTGSVSKADWAPLQGRDCTFWPDADIPGVTIVDTLYGLLAGIAPRLRWIDPDGLPEGHDAADLLEEGWDTKRVLAWARPRLREKPHEPVVVPRGTEVPAGPALAPEGTPVGDSSASGTGEPGESSTDADPHGYEEYASVNPQNNDEETPGEPEPAAEAPAETPKTLKRGKPREDAAESSIVSIQAQGLELSTRKSRLSQWQQLNLETKTNSTPYNNMDNVVRVLQADPVWRETLWFDTFHQDVMRRTPEGRRAWGNDDYRMLMLYLQRNLGMAEMGMTAVEIGLATAAMMDSRNELTRWLDDLVWDKEERLKYLFCDGFGSLQTPYTEAVSRCWLVSLVARAYTPGCQVDTVPILEGSQGVGKSTALRILGGPWFAECHEDMTNNQEFGIFLQGKWMIEISEMHSFSQRDVNLVKGQISNPVDHYRGKYERKSSPHPRQCVFAGTTNLDDWNADATGARRFWPIACTQVDWRWIKNNREQLFAEAVAIFKRVALNASPEERMEAGADWWNIPKDLTEPEQEARKSEDSWEELIDKYINFEGDSSVDDIWTGVDTRNKREAFSVNDVLESAIGMERSKREDKQTKKVVTILKKIGMHKWKDRKINKWYWQPGGPKK